MQNTSLIFTLYCTSCMFKHFMTYSTSYCRFTYVLESPGPQFSPRQVHVGMCWTKGHWDRFFTESPWFILSVSLYQCSTLIYSSINDAMSSQKLKSLNNTLQKKKNEWILREQSPLTIHNNRLVTASWRVPGPEQRPRVWWVLAGRRGGGSKGTTLRSWPFTSTWCRG